MNDWIAVPYRDNEPNRDFIDNCRTTACIAGWACLLGASETEVQTLAKESQGDDYEAADDASTKLEGLVGIIDAEEILGLSHHEAMALFMARGSSKNMSEITTQESVEVLREIASWEGPGSLEVFITKTWAEVTETNPNHV